MVEDRLDLLFAVMEGKDITRLIAVGREQLAYACSGAAATGDEAASLHARPLLYDATGPRRWLRAWLPPQRHLLPLLRVRSCATGNPRECQIADLCLDLYKEYGTTMAGLKVFTNSDKAHVEEALWGLLGKGMDMAGARVRHQAVSGRWTSDRSAGRCTRGMAHGGQSEAILCGLDETLGSIMVILSSVSFVNLWVLDNAKADYSCKKGLNRLFPSDISWNLVCLKEFRKSKYQVDITLCDSEQSHVLVAEYIKWDLGLWLNLSEAFRAFFLSTYLGLAFSKKLEALLSLILD
ncbi:unnamed protein product [Miscanthus lutarioriparius]|uniref:Uncharacterized protein n=1 Tax=Miscanthus lutarioriparius TaxID=422564 RepID=A0A811SKB7_9POAL|nr:unnamed protein product [Miscanthus lutarioriparius]